MFALPGLAELKLPGAGDPAKELRLDPLRSDLDRRREVTLHQLATCHIGYAVPTAVQGVAGVDALTSRWRVHWTPQTDAMLEVAGIRGGLSSGACRRRVMRSSNVGWVSKKPPLFAPTLRSRSANARRIASPGCL